MSGFDHLKKDPVGAIADWQDMRWPWVLMAAVCVLLVLVAHYMFQVWLYMAPCEQCVYIRFGFLVMAIGGLICVINPKNLILKVLGYAFAFAGAIYGLKCSVKLEAIHHAIHSDDPTAMFGMQGCSSDPHYPFDLPLAQWAPDWFTIISYCRLHRSLIPDSLSSRVEDRCFFALLPLLQNLQCLRLAFFFFRDKMVRHLTNLIRKRTVRKDTQSHDEKSAVFRDDRGTGFWIRRRERRGVGFPRRSISNVRLRGSRRHPGTASLVHGAARRCRKQNPVWQ